MEINVGAELHTGNRVLPNFGIKIGESGPEGRYLSKARSGTERSRKAKVNGAAAFLHRLLHENAVNALLSKDRLAAYVEYRKTSTGELYQGYYDDDIRMIFWNGKEPPLCDKLLPFIVFALHDDSPFPETRNSFKRTISDYITKGSADVGEIYQSCDDFYYEMKNYYGSLSLELDNTFDIETIKQSCRTGQMEIPRVFSRLNVPELEVVRGIQLPKAEAEESSVRVDYGRCKKGDFILDNVWELGQEKYIPPLSNLDKFVPTTAYYAMVNLINNEMQQVIHRRDEGINGDALIGENYINILLVGKPGTGKTTIAYALASTFGMPIRTVTLSKGSEEDTFEGKTKTVSGSFNFVQTPFLEGFKNGGIVCLEEINLIDPGTIMGSIGQAIEAPFLLYEDGYKSVKRNPFTVFISTMNTATQGSREPSEAFTNRSPYVFMIDDPEDEDFIRILQTKGYAERDCRRVFDVYKRITEYLLNPNINEEEVASSIGVRTCFGALKLMSIGCSFKDAVNHTMIGTIAIKNLVLARQIRDELVDVMPAAA